MTLIMYFYETVLFSNSLISDHQFGVRPHHSNLDMLLLLPQQWLDALYLKIVRYPALLAKLSACGMKDYLHVINSFMRLETCIKQNKK